jgi:hypothetical protein
VNVLEWVIYTLLVLSVLLYSLFSGYLSESLGQ